MFQIIFFGENLGTTLLLQTVLSFYIALFGYFLFTPFNLYFTDFFNEDLTIKHFSQSIFKKFSQQKLILMIFLP